MYCAEFFNVCIVCTMCNVWTRAKQMPRPNINPCKLQRVLPDPSRSYPGARLTSSCFALRRFSFSVMGEATACTETYQLTNSCIKQYYTWLVKHVLVIKPGHHANRPVSKFEKWDPSSTKAKHENIIHLEAPKRGLIGPKYGTNFKWCVVFFLAFWYNFGVAWGF